MRSREDPKRYERIKDGGARNYEDAIWFFVQTGHADKLALFRGEAEDYRTSLLPRAFRELPATDPYEPEAELTKAELEEVRRCQGDMKEQGFEDPYLRAFLPQLHPDDVNWLLLAQHHREYKTRLLDVTRNFFVALYFACCESREKQGRVHLFYEAGLRAQHTYEGVSGSKAASTIPVKLHDLFETDPDVDPKTRFWLVPPIPNQRLIAQAGSFVWWRPFGSECSHDVFNLAILPQAKEEALKMLTLGGITRETLFPGGD